VGPSFIDKARLEKWPCTRDGFAAPFRSSVQRLPEPVSFPNVLCYPPCFTSAYIGPMAELPGELRRLFDAKFECSFAAADAHQKSRHTTVAHDALDAVRLGFQGFKVGVS
jgi:hypothetical protein